MGLPAAQSKMSCSCVAPTAPTSLCSPRWCCIALDVSYVNHSIVGDLVEFIRRGLGSASGALPKHCVQHRTRRQRQPNHLAVYVSKFAIALAASVRVRISNCVFRCCIQRLIRPRRRTVCGLLG
jgi:hypothetical protein